MVPRILIVEDDANILKALKIILKKHDFDVEIAVDGQDALEKMTHFVPDLIISDVMMPRMDGFTFFDVTRKNPVLSEIPFVFLTALGDTENKIKRLEMGAYEYFTKPFNLEELVARVKMMLQRIQERKQHIEEIHHSEKSFLRLQEVSEYISTIESHEDLLDQFLPSLLSVAKVDVLSLWVLSNTKKELRLAAYMNTGHETIEGYSVSVEDPIFSKLDFSKPLVKLEGSLLESLYKAPFKMPAPVKTALCIPLTFKKRTNGLLLLGYKTYDPKNEPILRILVSITSTILEDIRLNEERTQTFVEIISSMIEIIEAKDPYTRGHSERVAKFATAIGQKMNMNDKMLRGLRLGGVLHDIGKVSVDDTIIKGVIELSEEEFKKVKSHPIFSSKILSPISFMADVVPMVYTHHEKWDGTGYPQGLKGEKIPLGGRIVAVADSVDAMTSHRPYRKNLTLQEAEEILKKNAGSHFDPAVVDAFISIDPEIKRSIQEYKSDIVTQPAS